MGAMKKAKAKLATMPAAKPETQGTFILSNGDIDVLLNSLNNDTPPLVLFYGLRTIPVEKSFKLEELSTGIRPISRVINNQRMKLIEKYGERDAKGALVQPSPGTFKIADQAAFNREFNALMAITHNISWEKITLDRKADLPEKGISGHDIAVMRTIVDFVAPAQGK